MKEKIIRIAPILLIIAIAILSIITLVTIANAFLGNGDNQNKQTESSTEKNDTSAQSLVTNEPTRSVKMTVRGPIVANENFRSYTIEVTPSSRMLTTYKGYLGEVIKSVKLDNNENAYVEFVNALNKANMMKGVALTGEADDLEGVCATGHIYDFSILKDNKVEKHLWTSTCKGSKGSLAANVPQLQNLFIKQVPDNEKFVKDLGLNEL